LFDLQRKFLGLSLGLWPFIGLVILTFFVIIYGKHESGEWLKFIFVVAAFMPITSAPFIFKKKRAYAFFHLCISIIGLITLTSGVIVRELVDPGEIQYWPHVLGFVAFIGASLSFISFLVSVPYAVIPYYRRISEPVKKKVSLISSQFLSESFTRIRSAIGQIEKSIGKDAANIDKAIDQLATEIQNRNKELQEIQKEQQKLIDQRDQYKTLAALTKQQANAVTEALRRGKYLDYVIGFILGLISGVIVFLLSTLLPYFR